MLPAAARQPGAARARLQALRRRAPTSVRLRARAWVNAVPLLLSLDYAQLAAWWGAAVLDADDPYYTPRAIELMKRPSLQAYVVTAERAARRFESLGVENHGRDPQGVDLSSATAELQSRFAALKRPGELVVGWVAAHVLTGGDRDSDGPLYNVDHLLDIWEATRARVPDARLWLVGGPSDRLRRRLAGRDDVLLLGRLPSAEALAATSQFDVAVYGGQRTPASGPPKSPSTSALASRRCRTTTR